MKRTGLWGGVLFIFAVAAAWVTLLVRAAPATQAEISRSQSGTPQEFKTFSCCETNIDFKKSEKGEKLSEQEAKTDIPKGSTKRTLDIKLMFHLTWECAAKADEPRHCVGRFSVGITANPVNTNGEAPESSSITITKVNEENVCPAAGSKKANGVFIFHYMATYPNSAPINGTLKLALTLDPKTKGKINHTYSISVKTKAGNAVDLGKPSIDPIP
jgi:hypothetical protein